MKVYAVITHDETYCYGNERVFISRELADEYVASRARADMSSTDARVEEMTLEEVVPAIVEWHTCEWTESSGHREWSRCQWADEERIWWQETDPHVRYEDTHLVDGKRIVASATDLETARRALAEALAGVEQFGWPEKETV